MNNTRKKQYVVALHFVLLITILSSCATQSTASQAHEDLTVSSDSQEIELKIDTTLRLNFPSGVRCIFEDSKGNTWFGSHQEGVCRVKGSTFTYFTIKDGLSDNQVRRIQEDQAGNIWFGTGNGVSKYDGKTISAITDEPILGVHIPQAAEWQMQPTDLWFNVERRQGIYRYDGKKLSFLPFSLPENRDPGNSWSVTDIAKGKNGKVWFATYSGVVGYDGTSFSYIHGKSLGITGEYGYLHIRSILEDSKGNLWIGNNSIGVLLDEGNGIYNFSEKKGLSNPFYKRGGGSSPYGTLEHVFSIGEDAAGNIWFGDRDTGAWRYDGTSMTNYTMEDGLTCPHIWDIYQTQKDGLWFAMGNGAVCKFNGKSFDRIY